MLRFSLPASEPSSRERWAAPEFEQELRAWVEPVLGAVRLERHKLRAWSTVWRVYAEQGLFWAKQNCPPCAFEARLLGVLAEIVPARVVPPAALDERRGLLLTPDQGPVLGIEHADIESWCAIVQQWAALQREVVPYVDQIADAGVTVLRPSDSEELMVERAAALHALPAEHPMRLTDEVRRRILDGTGDVRRAVDVVGALGLPITLNHNDLHGANVFASDGEELRFFDFGDAMLTEPMGVLLVPLGILVDILGCATDDPRLWRVADAWTEVWSDLASPVEMRAALPHALRLSRLARHESWLRITPSVTAAEMAEWGSAPSAWLGALPDRPLLACD